MIKLQKYVITWSITWLFQIIKEENWVINMIPLIYFLLIIIILTTGLKIKKLTDTTRKNYKEESNMPPIEGDEEGVREGK